MNVVDGDCDGEVFCGGIIGEKVVGAKVSVRDGMVNKSEEPAPA